MIHFDMLYSIMTYQSYIPREHYMARIRGSRGSDLIKVLTGIRRCGKSTLMGMYIEELKDSGFPENRLFSINLDDEESGVETFQDLIDAAKSKVDDLAGSLIFLDEPQNIPDWERAVSTFHVRGADIYITGSNSVMLSSELATKLSGRCLEIRIQPLMFSEYVSFRGSRDRAVLLEDYLRHGGFPAAALAMDRMPAQVGDILDGIYNTVFNKDVVRRHEIRNTAVIDRLCRHLMKNIGDRTSVRGAANYMTSKGMRTQPPTVDEYIGFLEEAFLFSRAKRLDSKAKEYLRTADKFYAADMGIRHCRVPFHPDDLDGIMENVVYNELVYRFGDVAVCSVGRYEVDFIADPIGSPSYYQVSLSILDPETRERELRPLKEMDDNYPKTVITYDRFPMDDIDGIRVVSLLDWLLESVQRAIEHRPGGGSDNISNYICYNICYQIGYCFMYVTAVLKLQGKRLVNGFAATVSLYPIERTYV